MDNGSSTSSLQMTAMLLSKNKNEKTSRHDDFLSNSHTFPKSKIKDFLRQAATDMITMLTDSPSTTAPSLQAVDPIRNGLLQLAKLLKRVENITDLNSTKPSEYPTPSPMFIKRS